MTPRRILSAAALFGALLAFGPAHAQSTYDNEFSAGETAGLNGVSPPAGASSDYVSGFLAGQAEAADQDDEDLQQQRCTERNLAAWQQQMDDRTTSLGPDPAPPIEGCHQ